MVVTMATTGYNWLRWSQFEKTSFEFSLDILDFLKLVTVVTVVTMVTNSEERAYMFMVVGYNGHNSS
jgi:hypothetical protein